MTTALLTVALTFAPTPPTIPDGAPFTDYVNDVHHRLELADWRLTPELLDEYVLTRRLINLPPLNVAQHATPPAPSVPRQPTPPPASVESWRPLVAVYFHPDHVDRALSVLACESQGNPAARNPRSSAAGLFQFIRSTWDWQAGILGLPTYDAGGPLNPENNIRAAANLSNGGASWSHWVCKP